MRHCRHKKKDKNKPGNHNFPGKRPWFSAFFPGVFFYEVELGRKLHAKPWVGWVGFHDFQESMMIP